MPPKHPALWAKQTPKPTDRAGGERGCGRRGARCVKPSGDAAQGTGRLSQQGSSPARFHLPQPPVPSTSRAGLAAAGPPRQPSLPHRQVPQSPPRPARPPPGRPAGTLAGVWRRREVGGAGHLAGPRCVARGGRTPLTAAGHQHQKPDCLLETNEAKNAELELGCSVRAATPALPASGGGPEVAPEVEAGSNPGWRDALRFSLRSRPSPPCPPGREAGADDHGLGFRGVSRAVRSEAGAARPGRRGPLSSPLSSPAARGVSRGPSAFPGRLGAGLEFDPAGRARALEVWGSAGAAHPGLPELAGKSRPHLVTLELQIKRAIF